MKAYKIHETIEFKQGLDPYSTLSIGKKALIYKIIEPFSEEISYELYKEGGIIIKGDINTVDLFNMIVKLDKFVNFIKLKGAIDLRYTTYKFKTPLIFPKSLHYVSEHILLFNVRQNIVLPNNLIIHGKLDVSFSDIKRLPDNLKIKGDLNISNTNISELPPNLSVSFFLYWENSKISLKYPKNTKYMKNKYKNMFWDKGIYIYGGIIS